MDLLRHGGMDRLFAGVRAPSTLGTFLRVFTFGHVRQLDAVASRLLVNLAGLAPLLPGAGELAHIDVDDTVRQTFGYAKQGAGRGYTGVNGLNALLATISTPLSARVIAAARLRKGSTNSVKGAHRMVADALVTATAAGATGLRVLRADSAFYSRDVVAACRRHQSRFSITARQDCAVRKAIAAIGDDAWTPIKYTRAVFDEDQQRWVSAAEVAETAYTAFTSKGKIKQVTARLIVRRVPDLNPNNQSCSPPTATTRCSPTARFRCSPRRRRTAHAVVEQVIADLKNAPPAHLPSGQFWANSAWLVCAAIAFNLTRAAGALPPRCLRAARPCDHRHHPRTTDQCAGPNRPLRAAPHRAPARQLAMGARLAAAAHRQHPTTTRGLTHPPVREDPTAGQTWKSRSARQRHHAHTQATTKPTSTM
jgi:hypothetical protein